MQLIHKIYHRFLAGYIECARVYRISLADYSIISNFVNNDRFVFKILDNDDYEKCVYLYEGNQEKLKLIKNRLNSEKYLGFSYVNCESNAVVYCRWICRDNFYSEVIRKELQLDEFQVLTLDSWTHPKSRGLGLHRNMNIEMLNWLKENSPFTEVYMIIKCFLPHLTKIPKQLGYLSVSVHYNWKRRF